MNLNEEIFYFINHDLANPFFDFILPDFTNFGGFVTLLVLSILAVVIFRYFKKDKPYEIAKLCLYALLVSAAIAATLKLAIHEPRPFTTLESVRQLVIPSEPNSFPSGHSTSTFSVVTVLIKKLWDEKLIVCLLAAFAVMIAFSRIYVGVHYPVDVLAGAAVGVVSGVVVLKVKN